MTAEPATPMATHRPVFEDSFSANSTVMSESGSSGMAVSSSMGPISCCTSLRLTSPFDSMAETTLLKSLANTRTVRLACSNPSRAVVNIWSISPPAAETNAFTSSNRWDTSDTSKDNDAEGG